MPNKPNIGRNIYGATSVKPGFFQGLVTSLLPTG